MNEQQIDPLVHGSLFSGIGGFDLAAEYMNWINKFHCEKDPFCQTVLNYYWPNSTNYNDITKADFTIWRGRIDVLSGGFPCQPYSSAGKRLGKEDERHLWPEMLRAIREIQPRWVVGENVRGLTNWNGGLVFDEVQSDLEAEGYEVTPFLLPACAVNAPHRRDRIWFIAHSNSNEHFRKNRPIPGATAVEAGCNGKAYGSARKLGGTDQGNDERGIKYQHVTNSNGIGRNEGDGNGKTKHVDEDGQARTSSDTNNTGRGKGNKKNAGRISKQLDRGSLQHASDTNGNGLQGRGSAEDRKEAERQAFQFHAHRPRNAWKDFPLEPPVCSGNDVLSGQLDGITFSNWRNNSIKAYGNAVVPEVVFVLFKAIQEYENQVTGM